MPKKIRLWICPCCRKYYPRKKADEGLPHCTMCGRSYRKGIKYPVKHYYNYKCIHRRKRAAAVTFNQKYHVKVRDLGGQVLRISSDTHKAFKALRVAKRIDYFERQSNLFLQSFYKDLTNYPDHCYRKTMTRDWKIIKVQGGAAMIPRLTIDFTLNGCQFYNAIYKRSDFINVFRIILSSQTFKESDQDVLLYNLLRQVIKWINSICGLGQSAHEDRIKWLSKKLNINGGV